MDELCEALRENDTLLSLNLNGTGLDNYCSKKLREIMDENTTLIL